MIPTCLVKLQAPIIIHSTQKLARTFYTVRFTYKWLNSQVRTACTLSAAPDECIRYTYPALSEYGVRTTKDEQIDRHMCPFSEHPKIDTRNRG